MTRPGHQIYLLQQVYNRLIARKHIGQTMSGLLEELLNGNAEPEPFFKLDRIKGPDGNLYYLARVLPLDITAYGLTEQEANAKLKSELAKWVDEQLPPSKGIPNGA